MQKEVLSYEQMTKSDKSFLFAWEKQQQRAYLPLFVFASLAESPKHMAELSQHLAALSASTMLPREMSLYRALQRWEKADLVTSQLIKGSAGPPYKQYSITASGERLLKIFVQRHRLMVDGRLRSLLRSAVT